MSDEYIKGCKSPLKLPKKIKLLDTEIGKTLSKLKAGGCNCAEKHRAKVSELRKRIREEVTVDRGLGVFVYKYQLDHMIDEIFGVEEDARQKNRDDD